MAPHQIVNTVIMPLFVLNMAAIVTTLFIKKRIKPEFSAKLNHTFLVENIIGIICVLALALIPLLAK